MENKFEHPRVRDARCFECLPNLRGDVRYKERRPVAVIVVQNDVLDGN